VSQNLLIRTIMEAVDKAVNALGQQLRDELHEERESYRKGRRLLKNVACCPKFTDFVGSLERNSNVLPQPVDTKWASVSLQIRGNVVIYCPFCGTDVTRRPE
jgi:hypothetical protein